MHMHTRTHLLKQWIRIIIIPVSIIIISCITIQPHKALPTIKAHWHETCMYTGLERARPLQYSCHSVHYGCTFTFTPIYHHWHSACYARTFLPPTMCYRVTISNISLCRYVTLFVTMHTPCQVLSHWFIRLFRCWHAGCNVFRCSVSLSYRLRPLLPFERYQCI